MMVVAYQSVEFGSAKCIYAVSQTRILLWLCMPLMFTKAECKTNCFHVIKMARKLSNIRLSSRRLRVRKTSQRKRSRQVGRKRSRSTRRSRSTIPQSERTKNVEVIQLQNPVLKDISPTVKEFRLGNERVIGSAVKSRDGGMSIKLSAPGKDEVVQVKKDKLVLSNGDTINLKAVTTDKAKKQLSMSVAHGKVHKKNWKILAAGAILVVMSMMTGLSGNYSSKPTGTGVNVKQPVKSLAQKNMCIAPSLGYADMCLTDTAKKGYGKTFFDGKTYFDYGKGSEVTIWDFNDYYFPTKGIPKPVMYT